MNDDTRGMDAREFSLHLYAMRGEDPLVVEAVDRIQALLKDKAILKADARYHRECFDCVYARDPEGYNSGLFDKGST